MNTQKDNGKKLTGTQGRALLLLARRTLMERFDREFSPADAKALETVLANDEALKAECGTFVTLKINEELRGCIGNLHSGETILSGIRDNAVNAAFHDPRFTPLTRQELDAVKIEISVLTTPQPLEYEDAADLIQKLRVDVDGVIVQKGHASATFLPQVWEQLHNPKDFLSYLCMKAGLDADEWRRSKLKVMTYQVQHFEEET